MQWALTDHALLHPITGQCPPAAGLTNHALLHPVDVLQVPGVAEQGGHGARRVGEVIQGLKQRGHAQDVLYRGGEGGMSNEVKGEWAADEEG